MNVNELKALRFTGIVECAVKSGESDPVSSYLTRLGGNLKYRRRRGGFYAFKGGFIQPLQIDSNSSKDPLTHLIFRFKESRISFLDRLVEAATVDKEECILTYSTRCRNVSEKVTSTPSLREPITVITYPRTGLLTVQGVFRKQACKPGEAINQIFKEGWRNG